MKTRTKRLFRLIVLIACLCTAPAGPVTAQLFNVLHSFDPNTGSYPNGGLQLSGKTLYGTTALGGYENNGSIFALNTDGTGFTNLYDFYDNDIEETPNGTLVLAGPTLYGTTEHGGSMYSGSIFSLNTNGSGFTNLYSFTDGSDGGRRKFFSVKCFSILN